MLPDEWDDIADKKPFLPRRNHRASFDFDVFTPPEEQGITESSPAPLPRTECEVLYVTTSSLVYPLDEVGRRLVDLADGRRTAREIVREVGGDAARVQERLFDFVRRGLLLVPLEREVAALAG
jgi:hypothetical protein